MFTHQPISSEAVKTLISQTDESSPGPDGIKYSDLGTLDEEELEALTELLNDSLADGRVAEKINASLVVHSLRRSDRAGETTVVSQVGVNGIKSPVASHGEQCSTVR